ncbi:MAG: phosphodiesterase [Oscillospiraceae bacterium]
MKYMIASDLHGSVEYVSRLMEAWQREAADALLLLGDLLYHGPRNDLPERYDTKRVLAMLNNLSGHIVAVRGNCDAEVDQMVLDFPLMADYEIIGYGSRKLFLTHGHLYDPIEKLPPIGAGDVMLSGHTHVPASFRNSEGVWFLNPGSVSIPKNGSPHSYMTLEHDVFRWKTLEGGVYRELSLEE